MNTSLRTLLCFIAILAISTVGCRNVNKDQTAGAGFDADSIGATDVIVDDLIGFEDSPMAAGQFNQLPPVEAPTNVYPVYFSYNQSGIPATEASKLNAVVDFMNRNPTIVLVVEGNCDERGTNEYNISLGEFRAQSVRDAIVASGIAAERIQTVSYGEEKPADPAHNDAAWAANRRADFAFYQGK